MQQSLCDMEHGILPEMPEFKVKSNPSADFLDAFVLPARLTHEQCQAALHEVIKRHDILRLTLEMRDEVKVFSILPADVPFKLTRIDLSKNLRESGSGAVFGKIDEIKQEFERSIGAFSAFTFLDLNGVAQNRLLVILDHINFDDFGVTLLTDDITLAIEQVMSGHAIQFDPPSASYRDWTLRAHEYLDSQEALTDLQYWRERPWSEVYRLSGAARGYVDESFKRITTMTLDPKACDSVFTWSRKARIPIWHLFLGCVYASLNETFAIDERPVAITTLVSQRTSTFDDIDLYGTLGELRAAVDFVMESDGSAGLPDIVKSVHKQIECAPLSGSTYELLRMRFEGQINSLRSGITFNYLGAVKDSNDLQHDAACNEVVSRPSPEKLSSVDDLDKMMRWPEYKFETLTPGKLYLLRLHFFEALAEAPETRYWDIWINRKIAIEKLDVFDRAGGKHKLLIEELICSADDAGCIQINLVSYSDSLANASINAIEIMEPIFPGALTMPVDLSQFRPVLRVNAGGPAIGGFAADSFANDYCGRDTDTTPVDVGANSNPASAAVYETDCYCSLINMARHWPSITLNCNRTSAGLNFWIVSYDSLHSGDIIHELSQSLLTNLKAVALW